MMETHYLLLSSLLHGDLDGLDGGGGCQSFKFWAATQGNISLWLPDPEDLRHFSVGERLEELTCLGEARRGS